MESNLSWRLPHVIGTIAITAIGFVVAAAMFGPATLPGSIGVLVATGAILGLRSQARPRTIGVGSAIGTLVVYAWTMARDGPPDSAGLRNGLSSAVLLGLIFAGAFVVPGYLFGRSCRRSEEGPSRTDKAPSLGAGLLETPHNAVVVGALILAADAALLLWYADSMSHAGP